MIVDWKDPVNQTQIEEVQNDDSLINETLWLCAFVFNLLCSDFILYSKVQ